LIIGDGPPDKVVSAESLSRLFDMPLPVLRERQPHVHKEEERH